MTSLYKLVVYVPIENADDVWEAIGNVGAGKIGNYSHCSFSVRGTGRFKPLEGADPHIGSVGKYESVEEERIEVTVSEDLLQATIAAMLKAHPYEEVAYDVYLLHNKN